MLLGRTSREAFLFTPLGQLALVLKEGLEPRCESLAFEIAPGTTPFEQVKLLSEEGVSGQVKSDGIPGFGKCVSFRDPKGTTIELFSEWTSQNGGRGAAASTFKLGHVAYSVPDPKALADFYQRVLGF